VLVCLAPQLFNKLMKTHTLTYKYTRSSATKLSSRGFTLIEFMVAIMVVGLVLVIGIPSMQDTIRDTRQTSMANATIGMLAFARSEAAKRPGANVTLCASTSTETHTPACDSIQWEDGWFIMTDLNGNRILDSLDEDQDADGELDIGEDFNGNGVLDVIPDEVLRIGDASDTQTIRSAGFPNDGSMWFDSSGAPNASGTFTICDADGNENARAIIISVLGHIRAAVDEEEPGDNIVNNHKGVNVLCPAT
jgi:type IV fimbrial biogenesis protein FimT